MRCIVGRLHLYDGYQEKMRGLLETPAPGPGADG